MLDQTVRRYTNRAIEAAQVIEELIQLAREMREANARGEAQGSPRTNWPSMMRLRRTTALYRCSATRLCTTSPASWSRPFGTTSESTGRYARTSAPTCDDLSSGSCASTATRPTSRRRRPRPCLNRPRRYPRGGPCETGTATRSNRTRNPALALLIAQRFLDGGRPRTLKLGCRSLMSSASGSPPCSLTSPPSTRRSVR